MNPTRRQVWSLGLGALAAGLALPAYAMGIEPGWRLRVTHHAPRPAGWPAGHGLTIAALADLHVGAPYMGLERIAEIVDATNALQPDLVVLLGDYAPSHRFVTRPVSPVELGQALARLRAPLGCFAILGNHDYWSGPAQWVHGLSQAGIGVLRNQAIRLDHGGRPVWLAGTASASAIRISRRRFQGLDNLPGTLAQVTDDAPVILLAHEPDIFVRVPARVALTLCGHTHGGQVRLLGWSPRVPSRFGNRFAYGHVVEEGRHLVVSGGLGFSTLPLRFGVPPEIVLVRLGQPAGQGA